MLRNSYKLRSQAACQSELGSCMDIEHRQEDPVVEIIELGLSTNSNRRSARLQKKERVASCSQDDCISEGNGIKCEIESSKSSYDIKNSDFRGKLGVKYVPQVQQQNMNDGVVLAETAVVSSKSATSVPTFEFHVRSEEGITLVIDLNSSPSDWSKSVETDVCLCQKFQKRKFQCFRQELEYLGNGNNLVRSSLIKNSSSDGVAEGHIQIAPSQNSIHKENGHVRFDQPAGDDGSSRFSVRKADGAATQVAVSSEKEKEVPFLSASGVSSTECCATVGEMETLDSVVHDAPQANHSSPVNLRKEGSESCRTIEEQSFKLNSTLAFSQVLGEEHNIKVNNETCGSTGLQDTCILESPIAEYPGFATICANLIQLSNIACQLKDSLDPENIWSPDLVDTMNTVEIRNSCSPTINEFDRSTNGDHTSEEREMRNAISDQSENWNESVSSSTHNRKRHQLKSDYPFGLRPGRILRSTKHYKGLLLRRSKRLVSKV